MSAMMMAAPVGTAFPRSNISSQIDQEDGSLTPKSNKFQGPNSNSNSNVKATLSPSPAIRESPQKRWKDDSATDPITPRRPTHHQRGMSLQIPLKEAHEPLTAASPRIPLSPRLDSTSTIYGSPGSVLPRRSRGMDFSRACTSLHHSTLAESSPDASPVIGRGIKIPQRKILGTSTVLDSPSNTSTPWLSGEKTGLSSSVSSINMLDSGSDSDSDSSADMSMDKDNEDPVLNTPAASRVGGLAMVQSPGMEWLNNPGPAQFGLSNLQSRKMGFRKSRLSKSRTSQSSSGMSMSSNKPSPVPLSPSIRPSVEPGPFGGMTREAIRSRRESLSLGTGDLHLDDDSDMETGNRGSGSGNDASSERGVVRRAVTRRSNLLPKTKGFARIKAALMEESDPLHSETRREAEVIKQVHESDPLYEQSNIMTANTTEEPLDALLDDNKWNNLTPETSNEKDKRSSFDEHAKRNSGGLDFWNEFNSTPPPQYDRYRTPPPPSLLPQDSSSTMSVEGMDVVNPFHDNSGAGSLLKQLHRSRSRSTTPLASAHASQASSNVNHHQVLNANDVVRKVNGKRRRDDDLDPASFKRRAVSPGMSAQSSPVIPQSPTMISDKAWGRPPPKTPQARQSNDNSSHTPGGGPRRVGLQGMTDANDGFMTMSID